jgi:hypothetical protein
MGAFMNHLALWQGMGIGLLILSALLHRGQVLAFKPFVALVVLLLLSLLVLALMSAVQLVYGVIQQGLVSTLEARWLASLIAVFIIGVLAVLVLQSKAAPAIHDITTDMDKPPLYEHATALRQGTDNSLTYRAEVGQQQREAYPDLKALVVPESPSVVFELAEDTAIQLGLSIHHADNVLGVIEATATSKLFGFVDDVVIRIGAEGEGSRVDVRSASRVGVSDLGANAKRIRAYLEGLKESLEKNQEARP